MDRVKSLREKIAKQQASVAIIGAGYVGLPAAIEAAAKGFSVTAIDMDVTKVQAIMTGRSYIRDVSDAELQALTGAGRLTATTDFGVLSSSDIVLICVPTPLTRHRVPDLTFVEAAVDEVAAHLHPGQLISLESTTYPGTTEELLLPRLHQLGLTVGTDFFLAYSPERVDPGNQAFSYGQLVRLVSGITAPCLDISVAYYRQVAKDVVPVSSTRMAEMAKLFENTYRAVNIAVVNEMALLCDRMGLNVWEVLSAAATKPFGIQPFQPGPGVGGHCIPLDPFYLAWKAREYDFPTRFIELAAEINSQMPYFVVQKLSRLLNEQGKPLRGARILVLGVAYKRDVPDVRESPALAVIGLLRQAGAEVLYHDPLVPSLQPHGPLDTAMRAVPLTSGLLATLDAVVLTTDHTNVDYLAVVDAVPLLLDTRGATRTLARSSQSIRYL